MNDDKVCAALFLDDLVPDEPIPDSDWTDKIPNDVVHVRMKFHVSFFHVIAELIYTGILRIVSTLHSK